MSRLQNLSSIFLMFTFSIVFIQCDDGLPDDPFANIPSALEVDSSTGFSSLDLISARTNFNNFPFEMLSDQEIKGIRFVREEEKVAVDFYQAMDALFDTDALKKIAQSEQTHFNVSGLAIDKYSLTDPTEGKEAGSFTSQSLQAHYNELIAEGTPSELEAWLAGAQLQEASLVTIQNELDRVANNRDLRDIYSSLRIATRNHLRAMVNLVNSNGGSYTAMFIDAAVFQDIVSSGFEVE